MMRLYHVPGSRSTRVLWMLEEIGAPYELTVMKREDAVIVQPATQLLASPSWSSP